MPTPKTLLVGYVEDQRVSTLLNSLIGNVTGMQPTPDTEDTPGTVFFPDGSQKTDMGSQYGKRVTITVLPPTYNAHPEPQRIEVTFAAGTGDSGTLLPSEQLASALKEQNVQVSVDKNRGQNGGTVIITYDDDLMDNLSRAATASKPVHGPASAQVLAERTVTQGKYQEVDSIPLTPEQARGFTGRL